MQYLKQDVQAQIEDAALRLFVERGFEDTSIAEVAKRAGVATGNVYRYFDNKEALYAHAVPSACKAEWMALFEERFAAAKKGLGAEWAAIAQRMAELAVVEKRRLLVLLKHDAAFLKRLVALCVARCAEHFDTAPSHTLTLVYENLFSAVAAILERGGDADAIAAYNAYHLGGLACLMRPQR